jgi:hypothetical protein
LATKCFITYHLRYEIILYLAMEQVVVDADAEHIVKVGRFAPVGGLRRGGATTSASSTSSSSAASSSQQAPRHGRSRRAWAFDWAGSRICLRFSGGGLQLRLNGGGNFFTVLLDGVAVSTLYADEDQLLHTVAHGLPDVAAGHTLVLTKRTEPIGDAFLLHRDSSARAAVFRGVVLDPGATLLPPPLDPSTQLPLWPARRRLLFVGDGHTTGFGNEAPSGRRVPDPGNSNAGASYACVCAEALGADAQLVAWSGKGVTHNAGDFTAIDGRSAQAMPFYLDRTLGSASEPAWEYRSWVPDAVVVLLGHSDFATPVRPFVGVFCAAYDSLLRKLRHQYPDALLCACSIEPNVLPDDLYVGTREGQLEQAAETARLIDDTAGRLAKGDGAHTPPDRRLVRVRLQLGGRAQLQPDDLGGMGHWGLAIHRAVGMELAGVLSHHLVLPSSSNTGEGAAGGLE